MSVKDPKDQKTTRARAESEFQEPAVKGAQQSDAPESGEEARGEEFDLPKENDYTEDVASLQAESAPSGIPRNLTEIKAQIENALRQNAVNGATSAQDASDASNIVGVGFGLGETHPQAGTPSLSSVVNPGEYALNVYVVDLTSVDQVKSVIVESMGASSGQ